MREIEGREREIGGERRREKERESVCVSERQRGRECEREGQL